LNPESAPDLSAPLVGSLVSGGLVMGRVPGYSSMGIFAAHFYALRPEATNSFSIPGDNPGPALSRHPVAPKKAHAHSETNSSED